MLPTLSAAAAAPRSPGGGGRRAAPRWRWRSAALALVACVIGLFVWAQYTILSTNLSALAVPAQVLPLQRLKKSEPKPESEGEQRLRHQQHPRRDPNVFGFGELEREEAAAKQTAPHTPRPTEPPTVAADPQEQEARRAAVVDAMRFAWKSYEQNAFGADEVDPKYGLRKEDVWGGIAVSLVDGMDTLWVMGLKDEFARARDYVATSLRFDHLGKDGDKISVFETIIREVGGLLSAFSLSGDAVFKRKATELMDLLLPAYSEEEGVFYTLFNPHTKDRTFASWAGFRCGHLVSLG